MGNRLYRSLITAVFIASSFFPFLAQGQPSNEVDLHIDYNLSPERLEEMRLKNELMRRKIQDDDTRREAEMRAWAKQNPSAAAKLAEIDETRRKTAELEAENKHMQEHHDRLFARLEFWKRELKIQSVEKTGDSKYSVTHANGTRSNCTLTRRGTFQDFHCEVPTNEGPLDYNCTGSDPPWPDARKTYDFGFGQMLCGADFAQVSKQIGD